MRKFFCFALASTIMLLGSHAIGKPKGFDIKSEKGVKFVTFQFVNEKTGELVEKRLPVTKGTLNAANKSAGIPAELGEKQCLVNLIVEQGDGSIVTAEQIDICSASEILIE